MRSQNHNGLASIPLPLDPLFLQAHGLAETEREIRKIVRSVNFEILEAQNAVRLFGPEMSYHLADPYLQDVLGRFATSHTPDGILSYRSDAGLFDLCFEDSWSGYFIANRYRKNGRHDDLVLIHLDDHTDMMSTLLCQTGGALIDPVTGATFDPLSPNDWESAIYSGAVSIGNFVTPFYYSGAKVHVRHVNNSDGCGSLSFISRKADLYDLVPGKQFAGISKASFPEPSSMGTYLAGSNSAELLNDIPQGWTVVHIDLDYFINDFDGASRGKNYLPGTALQFEAMRKMDQFFSSMANLRQNVDQWIIATSPGFCCALHWEWLLSEVEGKICEYDRCS